MTHSGEIVEVLPNGQFRVDMGTGEPVIAYASGKMKFNRIRVLLGDKVEVVLDPYGGKTTNRIVKRL